MAESNKSTDAFPERLRLARAKRELSQDALAGLTGLQPSAISHFETGARKPSFDNLRRLADALDVTTDYLLGRVEEMQDLSGADRLHRDLARLSGADREMTKDFIEMLSKKAKAKDKK